MDVLLCERVKDLHHSHFYLLNCLITIASELREEEKVTGSKIWTIGRLRNCLDTHLGHIVGDKDGVGQSTLVYWLPYSSHTSHHPSQTPCLTWISYATQKLMLDSCKMLQKQCEAFHTFLRHFFQVQNRILLHIVLLKCPHVQIAFLKLTSCDNQALVGCIPIVAVAVHLKVKS